jgi:hypothetical protein
MKDETAAPVFQSARNRLQELIQQENDLHDQIAHWAPIVEQLAKLSGEKLPADIQNRINQLNNVKQPAAVDDMGLTEAIRWVFRQPLLLPLTPTQVRDNLSQMGYDLDKYAHVMPPIHNTLKRMKEAGEIREVEGVGGLGKAYVSAK